ncbi:MAG: hypothetical protein ABIJ43_02045 [Candidatus Beckwithbacteria bacterium]|nr:hypothetical protein [Patescibacteria group bacterium]
MLRNGVEEKIKERIKKLKSGKAKAYFLSNIFYPSRQQLKDKKQINQFLEQVEAINPSILDLIKLIRSYFKNIWDQNKIVASYLLLCKAHRVLDGVVNEARVGNVTGMVELCRSGIEAVDLVFLLMNDENDENLKKWFRGEIIGNKIARESEDKVLNKMFRNKIPVKQVKDDIYWVYSLYTHSGYGSILDLVDVYNEDFDFKRYSQFHYINSYLHLIENLIVNILLGVKNVLLFSKNLDGINKVDEQLKMFKKQFASSQEILDLKKKYS